MTFSCLLERPSTGARADVWKPSLERLDYEVLVMECCLLLSETDARFRVGGFGQGDWHLDVAYDLSVAIEQLPPLLTAVRAGVEAELDFYSQGIERGLDFSRSGQDVIIKCHSRTPWVPNPATEVVSFRVLDAMLVRLAHDFAASLESMNHAFSSVPPFRDWLVGRV
ncbi:hypothetical protein [Micromonospora avicenniae]|uniref:hypothetical protein n=1 Tax=Micromonospora avicenniae TaxID=1198245 RepID=UPI0033348E67